MSFEFLQLINLIGLCLFSLVLVLKKYRFDHKVLNTPDEITYLEIKLTRYKNNVKLCCIRTFAFLSLFCIVLSKIHFEQVIPLSVIDIITNVFKYAFLSVFTILFALRSMFFFSGYNKADELTSLLLKRFPHGGLAKQAEIDYRYVKYQVLAENVSMFLNVFCLLSAIGLTF